MIKSKKQYGQNFITDKNLINKIIEIANPKDKHVIEIGPGKGALTFSLYEKSKTLICYEIDKDLKDYFNYLQKQSNFNIIYDDYLKRDLSFDLTEDEYILVSNTPYYITSPIIISFLETPKIKRATLMLQKEFADRLLAKPNTKQYNQLTVLVNYYCDVKQELKVNRTLFKPVPKVDSVVINLTKHDKYNLTKDEEINFLKFIKFSFKQKRKTLVNNLCKGYNVSKKEIITFLENNNINPKIRAENINIETLIKLSKNWYKK